MKKCNLYAIFCCYFVFMLLKRCLPKGYKNKNKRDVGIQLIFVAYRCRQKLKTPFYNLHYL